MKSLRFRYFSTVLSRTSSSFLQMTVTTMMSLLVALQSVLLSSTSKANERKQFPLLFIVQHRAKSLGKTAISRSVDDVSPHTPFNTCGTTAKVRVKHFASESCPSSDVCCQKSIGTRCWWGGWVTIVVTPGSVFGRDRRLVAFLFGSVRVE